MKLLLISDLANTGFGRVGRELGRRFIEAGVDLRVIGVNWRGRTGEAMAALEAGHDAAKVAAVISEIDSDPFWQSVKPAALGGDGMGHNLTRPAIEGHVWPDWTPDKVLIVADPWALYEKLTTDGGAIGHVPTWCYVPIEGIGLPPSWAALWNHVQPIAMSEFGRIQLEKLLRRPVDLVHHGVSETFYPVSPTRPGDYKGVKVTSKDAAKDVFGWRGKTVILRVDRLVPRKNYPALFTSMEPVLDEWPDAKLVIHCSPIDEGGDASSFLSHMKRAERRGATWSHPQITFTKAHDTFRGLSDESLNVLYNAADIYVSPTMAEGFGLCEAEALSCGVPVVVTDYSACPEVVGPGGSLVPVERLVTNQYANKWALVDEAAFSKAVSRLIEKPARRREQGEAGRRHVAQFTWQGAADAFLAILDQKPLEVAA